MKVLLINSEHALIGGAHTVYFSMADLLRSAGADVVCFAMHSPKELPCKQSHFFAKENNRNNSLQYTRNSFYNRDAACKLQELINKEKPDIAHIHLVWGCLAPSILIVLKKNHIPIIHTVHDYAMICSKVTLKANDGSVCEKCRGGRFGNSIISKCHGGSLLKSIVTAVEISLRNRYYHPVKLIDHFHFVSKFCAEKHIEMDDRFKSAQLSILYNVPDLMVQRLSRDERPNTFNGYFLYYGRLAYEKGVETLINVFAQKPNLYLKIVGTGPLEKQLREICKRQKISNIEFLGFKSGDELYRIVRNAKFVCVPSEWYENNPMTIIEAYTLSTPVIASRIGGIPEIVINNQTGFLFESANEADLESVLLKTEELSLEQYEQMKNCAYSFSRNNFNRDSYAPKLFEIYYEVINNYKQNK